MKKTVLVIIMLLTIVIIPIQVNADNPNINNGFVYIAEKKSNTQETDPSQWNQGYDQEQNCSGDSSILGNVNDPNSVAWLLQKALDYLKVLGPILVVVLSSVEFAKVIINSDDEAMKKAQNKLITRLILAACLFLIPHLVGVVLSWFNITSDSTCGLS